MLAVAYCRAWPGWAEQRVGAAGSGSVWAKYACWQKSWLGSGTADEVEPDRERGLPCYGHEGRDNVKGTFTIGYPSGTITSQESERRFAWNCCPERSRSHLTMAIPRGIRSAYRAEV